MFWSSPGGRPVGHEVWDGTLSASAAYEQIPELRAFAALEDVKSFSLSAIFQIVEDEGSPLVARGSPVLTEKVQRAADDEGVKVEIGGPTSKRVPVVSVQGRDAVAVGKVAVEQYSRYIVGLFANFD